MKENDKLIYCPHCQQDVSSTVRTISESYPVKGEEITVEAQVRFCNRCGSEVWDEELDPQNLERAFSVYRQKHGLAPGAPLHN